MMTRSLAENYPYSQFYKTAIRGARQEWLEIVERLETGDMPPKAALNFLISQLLNQASEFEKLADDVLKLLENAFKKSNFRDCVAVTEVIKRHINESDYPSRLMEIAMHSLMQAVEESDVLGAASLVPLSQMRSANKKHGNIGDIELQEDGCIIESWDAKFGKPYLRDELEELNDKLRGHDELIRAGFVSSETPELRPELIERAAEIEQLRGIQIRIISLDNWIAEQFDRVNNTSKANALASQWLTAYVESLAQKRARGGTH